MSAHEHEPNQIDIRCFPQCSECHVAYVLRRAYMFGEGRFGWVFQPDCKHKKAESSLVAS